MDFILPYKSPRTITIRLLILVLAFLLPIQNLFAQTCPVGTAPATFAWDSGSGTGNLWPANSTSNSYTINYTDEFGLPNTVGMTVNLIDPNNRNYDSDLANPHPFGDTAGSCGGPLYTPSPDQFPATGLIQDPWDSDCILTNNFTQTNGIFGGGTVSYSIKTIDHLEEVTFQFVFDKAVAMDSMVTADVDYVGYQSVVGGAVTIYEIPGDSFQDEVRYSATDAGGANVPLTLVGGSNITVAGQTGRAAYNTNLNGNLGPTDPAGFITVSSAGTFTSFNLHYSNGPGDAADEQANPNDYTYWSTANGPTNGVSDSQTITIGGFSFCVDEPPPELTLTKTSSANGGPVSPGDPITYTIEIENTGLGTATDVVVNDTLPTGVTYVASSAQKTYFAGGSGSFSQDLGAGTFDTPGLTQSYTVTAADVPSGATLTNYGFTATGASIDWLSDISLTTTYPGGTAYTTAQVGSFGGNGPGSFTKTLGPDPFGGPAEGTYTFVWGDGFDGTGGDDNSVATAVFTIDYATARVSVTDAAGAPPNLITAAENISIQPGETVTITFDVTVDNPLNPAITQLTNTASVTSTEITTPVTDTAIDSVAQNTGSIGDTIFNDLDGDGVFDAGEGLAGVDVTLTGTDINGNPINVTVTTVGDGQYLFSNLPQSNATGYTVTVDETDLPLVLQGNNTVDPDGSIESQSVVVLGAGEDNLAQDFGYQALGSIGDTIFNDLDGDGTFDAGEGLAGVDVTLTGTDVNGNPINVAVTTAGDGQYLFSNLPQSNATGYTVTVDETDLPLVLQGNNTVDPDGGTESQSVVVLGTGEDNLVQDFGYQALGSIGDTIFNDLDGDGVFDTGEGLAGVDVTLTGTDINGNPINVTVTTAGDGQYLFPNLPQSDASGYTVTVDETDLPLVLQGNNTVDPDGGNDSTSTVVLGAGEDNLAQDFGYQALGSIGDTIFNDLDGDGVFDTGEGLAGVDVTLTGTDVNGNPINVTVTTAGDGQYLFMDVPQSNATGYTVAVDETDLPLVLQGNNTVDPDGGTESQSVVVLGAGEDNLVQDFGYQAFAGIGDFVWNDGNGNGIQDSGEVGINGVTVNLLDSGGAVISTTTTGPNPTTGEAGYYEFVSLDSGDYQLEFFTPVGYVFSPQDQTSDDLDSDVSVTNGRTSTITLAIGEINTDVDAGMVAGGSIGDHIWLDTDSDGVDDVGEQGIAGVTVNLTGTDAGGNPVNLNTITDANGDYLFDNLAPGNYTVTVTDTNSELANLTQSPGNTGTENVVLSAGENFLDADFGYVPVVGTAVIGDTVWSDVDADGSQDPGEVGIAGVSLNLLNSSGAVIDTTTTDAAGNYLFTNVLPGDYSVVVTDTGGVITDAATNVTSGPQSPGSLISDPITILSGDIYVDADFGFALQPGSTLSDRLWYDADGDGVQDVSEPGIGNVTVDLLDSGGLIIASVVTDSNGDFAFTGLSNGGYTISITDDNSELTGYFDTTVPASLLQQSITALTGDITNQDPAQSAPITNGSGNGHPSFGFNQPGMIGDRVWNDANADGVQDPGESGISGVTLTLTGNDSSGNPVNLVATTDASGNYLFMNVADGLNYTVTVDANNFSSGGALEGYIQTYDADDGAGASDNQSSLPLAPGNSNLNQDFGYQNTSLPNISGTVFYDVDTDGTHEPAGNDGLAGNSDDETGLTDVSVALLDSIGNVVATTVTDSNGDYIFPNVVPADYTVAITDTNNVLDGYTLTSGLDQLPVAQADLNAGDVTDVDFGYVDNEQTAAITSALWIDTNQDGIKDPGEQPITAVDIQLLDCGNDGNCGNADDGPTQTTSTDAVGNVIFPDLPAGNYQLDPDESDPDFPAGIVETIYPAGVNPSAVISLSEGQQKHEEFGFVSASTMTLLSGTIWSDANSSGIQDTSEIGLGNVIVIVRDATSTIVANTTTNPDGTWNVSVTPDPAGSDYYVSYNTGDIPSVLDATEPTNTGDIDGDGANDQQYVLADMTSSGGPDLSVTPGDIVTDLDFGFGPDSSAAGPGAIEGTVYLDLNANSNDDTEPGIELVTLNLVSCGTGTCSDGDESVIATVTTDENGDYSFTGVLPGDYIVEVSDTNNATIGLNETEMMGGLTFATVTAGNTTTDIDFGYSPEQNLGSIGNLIWLDDAATNDGLFNPEQGDVGLAGVTVQCWYDTDNDGVFRVDSVDNLIREVQTNENGEYYCEGVPTGTYFVRITDEKGVLSDFIDATIPQTPRDGTANDPDNSNAMSVETMLATQLPTDGSVIDPSLYWKVITTSPNYTVDFAVRGALTLTGMVYDEGDATSSNSTFDGADVGVPGATIAMTYTLPSSTTVTLTTTTAPDGTYSISIPTGMPLIATVDPSGTIVDGHTGTENPTGSVSFPAQNLGDTPQANFGFQDPPAVTNPITLGYFHAERGVNVGEITIRWQTVIESGNAGFNLYGKAKSEDWQRLNSALIVSPVGDSVELQKYEYVSVGPVVSLFAIGDVDIFGQETIRGPFKLGQQHGVDRTDRNPIDWSTIHQQSNAKKAVRKAKREARRAQRMKQMEQRLDQGEQQMRRTLKRKQRLEQKALKRNGTSQSSNQSPPASSWHSRLIGAMLLALVPSAQASVEPVTDPGLIYFKTSEPGIYRVTYEQLLAQGIDLTGVKHWRLALMHNGESVDVRSKGQTSTIREQRWYFGPGGWIEFVADEADTLYSQDSIYVLYEDFYKRKSMVYDETNPNSIAAPVTTRYTATVEMDYDVFYSPAASVADPWYARRIVSTDNPVSTLFPIQVDHILSGPVSVNAGVWGGFAGDHHVDVQLNDYAVGTSDFNGFTAQTISGQTTTAALVEGLNHVKVTVTNPLPEDQVASIVHTDTWSVSYPRRLIVDSDTEQLIFSSQDARLQVQGYEAFQPGVLNRRVYRKRPNGEFESLTKVWMPLYADGKYRLRFAGDVVEESTYYVSLVSGLKQVEFVDPVEQQDLLTGNAQYLVISHPDFIDEHMEALIAARQGQGYSTKVADVEAVYSAFGHGHFGADAIQRYIHWAHANLGTEMVLLVGADTYDYHDHLNTGSMSFMPSLYVQTSDRIYHAPSDSKYADVDDDDVPDMSIGRMIPRTTQEWANSVTKTLQYASHPNPRSLVMAVDELDQAANYSFSTDADMTIAELPGTWQQNITRAYMDELGVGAARSALLEALNQGQAVAGMFGHSGPQDWTFAGLFKSGDAAALTNAGSPTVITQWGCWNTYYVHPSEDTLTHQFMLNDLNGAAAVLGASTLTEADHERELAKQVYPRMFTSGKSIGEAILQAKQAHAQSHSDELDVILGWNLIGDPALIIETGG